MILPIYLLGTPELREATRDVHENSEALQSFIDDMLETMVAAKGIGLAAPQLGRTERLFVVDIAPVASEHYEEDEPLPPQPMVFLNARILDESEDVASYEEGCLSIPDIHEEVNRSRAVRVQYLDRNFDRRTDEFHGMLARVIQHEYDHVEGVLFIDHVSPFRRRLIRRKLKEITEGVVETDYPIYARDKGVLFS